MRILLQDVRTQLFLRDPDTWTADPFEALDFHHSLKALDYARDHHLPSVQIAVKFLDSHFDEVVALPPIQSGSQPQRRL
jgi:hypothetical protein